uniref:WH2 domain-containing protein n=1 Tax=Neogobius melanostomus TaxID=47308 RepID=A0A8C6SRC2_9GOBI
MFGYRRELRKYEEVDEDELLASLSLEEIQELEQEMDDLDPDTNVPIGLRQRDQTAKTPEGVFNREALLKYWEEENKKLIQEERQDAKLSQDVDILKELRNSLKPSVKPRDEVAKLPPPQKSGRDDLMAAIRGTSIFSLKRVRFTVCL